MKTHLFKLGSVGKYTVGGPEAGMINLIYSYLLQEYKQYAYSHIYVHQITPDIPELKEMIIKEPGHKIYINVLSPIHNDFERKSPEERCRIRLDVAHSGLMKIAREEGKLDQSVLIDIKNLILNRKFLFEINLKTHVHKKNQSLIATIVVEPKIDRFDYFVNIEENGQLKCKIKIYTGGTDVFYIPYFFKTIKWTKENELILTGSNNEVETRIEPGNCTVQFINKTSYPNPPLFTSFRYDISENERNKAWKDYEHSLPPAFVGITRESAN